VRAGKPLNARQFDAGFPLPGRRRQRPTRKMRAWPLVCAAGTAAWGRGSCGLPPQEAAAGARGVSALASQQRVFQRLGAALGGRGW